MKKLFLPAIICSLFLFSFTYVQDWVKYISSEGHYTIFFPVTPIESTTTDTTEDKIPYLFHYATCAPVDTEVYLAGWTDMSSYYPKDKTIKQLLEETRDKSIAPMHVVSVATSKIELGEDPFIEFTFRTTEYVGKERLYIINKFQYSIITLGSLTTGVTQKMDKFITSFKYLR